METSILPDPENPLTWNELIDKFKNLMSPVFSDDRQTQIIDKVRSLEQLADLDELSMLLAKD
jgi:hypothetical protein